jgi:hypothetical protein
MAFVLRRVASAEAATNTRAHHPLNHPRDQIYIGRWSHEQEATKNLPICGWGSNVGLDRHKPIRLSGVGSFLPWTRELRGLGSHIRTETGKECKVEIFEHRG